MADRKEWYTVKKRKLNQSFSNNWTDYENNTNTVKTTQKLVPVSVKGSSSTSNDSKLRSMALAGSAATPTLEKQDTAVDVNFYLPSIQNKAPTVSIPDDGRLNSEQRFVVESVLSGYSTFYSGPAGCGKSYILEYIMRYNDQSIGGVKKRIVITATTGLAACNVGGVTIHSFAGIGTGEESLSSMISKVVGNEYAKKRWRECDVLIIDEVSMMPASLLDALSSIASRARNDNRSFGGIQLVLCGDFFQLPPVNLGKHAFAFEAKCWPKIIRTCICLTQIFRQRQDVFMGILNEARIGELSQQSIATLRQHCIQSISPKPINAGDREEAQATLIECRNTTVDRLNTTELGKLPGESQIFRAVDWSINKTYEAQLRHCQAPDVLELKVGATVMLLKNIDPDHGLVNGVRGVVVGFKKASNPNEIRKEFRKHELPLVRFELFKQSSNDDERLPKLIEPSEWTNKVGDNVVSSRLQIPLRLGYALTAHKSQGMTIPNLVVNLSDTFEYGQAYVALSRATSLDKLVLKGFHERNFKAHPKVKQFYRMLEGASHNEGKGEKAIEQLKNREVNAEVMLTEDQRKRIEENRLRALALRQNRFRQAD